MNKIQKVALTGGHFAPAAAIVEEYLKKKVEIIFLGRKYAYAKGHDITLEYRTFHAVPGIHFYELDAGRFKWSHIMRIIKGFLQAFFILLYTRPSLLLSFGGYLAVPAVIAAWLLRIRIVLHEQTIAPGKANQFSAIFADKIYTAFPEAAKYFPAYKTSVIGNPLRNELSNAQQPLWFNPAKKPLLLVLGGSTGSHSVNKLTEEILPHLTAHFQVVHQTGESSYRDFERLSVHTSPLYTPVKFITTSELGFLYREAAVIVSRSGANTFFDLLHFKKPAVLIPLPWAAHNEQQLHAELLAKNGVAQIHPQQEESAILYHKIYEVYTHNKEYAAHYKNLKLYEHLVIAPRELIHAIETT